MDMAFCEWRRRFKRCALSRDVEPFSPHHGASVTVNPALFGAESFEDRLLTVARELGRPVDVRRLAFLMSRRFGGVPDEGATVAAVAAMVSCGRLERGANGQEVKVPEERPLDVADLNRSEAALMDPLSMHLKSEKANAPGAFLLVKDTSRIGAKGIWRRPDFVGVRVLTLPILGRRHLDVSSYELKNEAGCTVMSVHEALHQTRSTHYGYLVWYLPTGSLRELDIPEIHHACIEHGIGLIRMYGPPYTFSTLQLPTRKPTSDVEVETFLTERFDATEKIRIASAMVGT